MSSGPKQPRGAYGFRFTGTELPYDLLTWAERSWPSIHLAQDQQLAAGTVAPTGSHVARFRLVGGGSVVIERDPARGMFETPQPIDSQALVHPYLVPVAAVHSYWRGHLCFHAGGFVVGGGTWGVLGSKQAGKSTLLALLASRGVPIVSDDLLVVADGTTLAGPRSVDLRGDAASMVEGSEYLGIVGARKRWRLSVPPVDPIARLAGFIVPIWADQVATRRMRVAERLQNLTGTLTVKAPLRDPAAMLPVVALPTIELARPKAWESVATSVDVLLNAISDLS